MIEIYINNKELHTYKVAYSFSLYCLRVQREPKDEHCVSRCTLKCNTLPLDNSKTYSHPALPYITHTIAQA